MSLDLKATAAEIEALLEAQFPQASARATILALEAGRARVRFATDARDLRPGGTISGPSMFAAADLAFYIATLSVIGVRALAVTTNTAINFLRKPSPGALVAEARVLKAGRTLCVGDATVYSEGVAEPVAHAALTYSIPPLRPRA